MVDTIFITFFDYFINQIYRFKGHYPYRSYRGSRSELSITVPNDKGHFSISAGVCFRPPDFAIGVRAYRCYGGMGRVWKTLKLQYLIGECSLIIKKRVVIKKTQPKYSFIMGTYFRNLCMCGAKFSCTICSNPVIFSCKFIIIFGIILKLEG